MVPYSKILLFDGTCNLCNHAVKWILRHEAAPTIFFAPLQSEAGQQLLDEYQLKDLRPDSLVYIVDGKCYFKSEAALLIALELKGGYRYLRWLKIFPRPLRDLVYDLVARYRFKIFGQRDTCMVPNKELMERFLKS